MKSYLWVKLLCVQVIGYSFEKGIRINVAKFLFVSYADPKDSLKSWHVFLISLGDQRTTCSVLRIYSLFLLDPSRWHWNLLISLPPWKQTQKDSVSTSLSLSTPSMPDFLNGVSSPCLLISDVVLSLFLLDLQLPFPGHCPCHGHPSPCWESSGQVFITYFMKHFNSWLTCH